MRKLLLVVVLLSSVLALPMAAQERRTVPATPSRFISGMQQ